MLHRHNAALNEQKIERIALVGSFAARQADEALVRKGEGDFDALITKLRESASPFRANELAHPSACSVTMRTK